MCSIVKVIKAMMNQRGNTHNLKLSLILAIVYFQVTLGLKYYYGDGSYFIGEVDEHGRPNGHGQFHNTTGALGKYLFTRLSEYAQIYIYIIIFKDIGYVFILLLFTFFS